tara:strand:- start:128 stop:367 length:240 start_codon:yes stop_codon:yes gene_type:complete
MDPNLVELNKIFKKKKPIIPKPKPVVIERDYTPFYFNILCIIALVGGIIFLVQRKENKVINRKKYEEKVNRIYNQTELI